MAERQTKMKEWINEEFAKSECVPELQNYIEHLHSCIRIRSLYEGDLVVALEKKKEKYDHLSRTHTALIEMFCKEQVCCEDNQKLIKQLTLKYRKVKKRNWDLKEGMLDLQRRVEDYEWVLECEERLKQENEKLKQENAELKEKMKHYLPWYERVRMEETENNDDN